MGSRTAAYVGIADNLEAAEKSAEECISMIEGPLYHRDDIGTAQLIKHRIDEMLRIRSL